MKQRQRAYALNKRNILSLLEHDEEAEFLDLGCDDGVWTLKLSEEIGTNKISGYEIIKKAGQKAKEKGVKVQFGDLNDRINYPSNSFDVIHANQVIEHLNNTDLFISEVYRLLRPRGYALISTENLSSWHNIFALLLGYMPFSLTNVSSKTGAVGNPLAPHSGGEFWNETSWEHQRIFTIRGLKHLSLLHGFEFESVLAAGYYPFGNLFSKLDPSHSAFITLKIRKV